MRALLIENDTAGMEPFLREIDLVLTIAKTGEDGVYFASNFTYDLIVLDLELPDVSGFEVLSTIRASGVVAPVLVVSKLQGFNTIVRALDSGADRYLSKPFHREELIALVTALVRRINGHSQSKIHIDDMIVDIRNKSVSIQDKRVQILTGQYRVLEALALHKGKALSRTEIYDLVYNDIVTDLSIITVFVCLLRKKFSLASGGKRYIKTLSDGRYILDDA